MTPETQSSPLRRRRLPAALALAPWLLVLAALPAAAQEWPPVNVYHSPDDDGADPRPAFPPGCKGGGGSGGGGSVLILEESASVAASLETDLVSLGHSVTRVTALPADLSPYAVIWHVAAYTALTAAERTALAGFLAGGGGLHLTGDHFACCQTLNDSLEVFVNSVVVDSEISVGHVAAPPAPFPFNSTAVGGVATTPNALEEWDPVAPGPVSGLDLDNVLVTGVEGGAVGAVWDSGDLVGGAGRLTLLMDVDWFYQPGRLPVIENLQVYLGAGSGPALDCVIKATANEQLDLWIDGGSSGGDGDICRMGPEGDTGDYLCGADIRVEITRGTGVFTHILPVIPTLVHHPGCEPNGGNGFCSLPDNTKRIRMNFRRGPPPLAPAGPRKVASLLVNSTDSTEASPTTVVVNGIAAVSANLQLRPIAAGGAEVIAEGPIPAPEPGGTLMLASGLLGLAGLYRLRRRRC